MIESEALKRSVETLKTSEVIKETSVKASSKKMIFSDANNPFEMVEDDNEQEQNGDALIKRKNIL